MASDEISNWTACRLSLGALTIDKGPIQAELAGSPRDQITQLVPFRVSSVCRTTPGPRRGPAFESVARRGFFEQGLGYRMSTRASVIAPEEKGKEFSGFV